MKICVGRTGHEIADRVADSLERGFGNDPDGDVFIGYGILRGQAEKFKKYRHWFEVDRGYFGASHYDGTYRISYRGTQQTSGWKEPIPHKMPLQPWRGFDHSKPVLVCPPTLHVMDFFDMEKDKIWTWKPPVPFPKNYIVREKGASSPINFQDYNYVITFNSSVGWQAIAAGIPCVSDTTYSMVGSFFNNISLADLAEKQYIDRERMFGCMEAMQFTLSEIEQGKAYRWIEHCLTYGLAGMAERQLPPKLQHIV